MENSIPGIKDLLKGVRGDVSKNIRQMPDFVVFKDNQAHFIEVKYRASGELKLKDIDKYCDCLLKMPCLFLLQKSTLNVFLTTNLKLVK